MESEWALDVSAVTKILVSFNHDASNVLRDSLQQSIVARAAEEFKTVSANKEGPSQSEADSVHDMWRNRIAEAMKKWHSAGDAIQNLKPPDTLKSAIDANSLQQSIEITIHAAQDASDFLTFFGAEVALNGIAFGLSSKRLMEAATSTQEALRRFEILARRIADAFSSPTSFVIFTTFSCFCFKTRINEQSGESQKYATAFEVELTDHISRSFEFDEEAKRVALERASLFVAGTADLLKASLSAKALEGIDAPDEILEKILISPTTELDTLKLDREKAMKLDGTGVSLLRGAAIGILGEGEALLPQAISLLRANAALTHMQLSFFVAQASQGTKDDSAQ
ncbi:MAG: hypothetical protein MHM6MM_002538 [Cercozoa sp. M6MM]